MPTRNRTLMACSSLLLAVTLLGTARPASAQIDPVASSISLAPGPLLLFSCIGGDGASVIGAGSKITVTVLDVNAQPVNGLVDGDFQLDGVTPFLTSDAFFPVSPPRYDTVAGGITSVGAGIYTLDGPFYLGGLENLGVIVKVKGTQILTGSPLPVTIVSPDTNGDGKHNAIDIGDIAIWYNSPVYDWRVDYNGDGTTNLADIAILGTHFSDALPAAAIVDPVD